MSKRTRLIIVIVCFALFFTITPWLILYSLGYQVDFKNYCVVATGGVYVRADPAGSEVLVDNKTDQKTGFFSNSIFVQNLSPQIHQITVKKDGYFWYVKNIAVQQNEVTKIENITLFKNTVAWENADKTLAKTLFDTQTKTESLFSLKSGNLYYADTQKPKVVLQKVISYKIYNNSIIWLGSDGNLNKSDISGKNTEILTSSPVLINKNNSYKIFVNDFGTFILKNKDLLLLNKKTGTFDFFLSGVNDLKVSPNNQNIFYATDNEIYLDHSNYEYGQTPQPNQKILLNKFAEKLSDIFWMNENYLIMRASNGVKISEIDNRENINIIDLPLPVKTISGEKFSLDSKSQITFNSQDKKLYILSSNILLASDRLLP